MDIAIEVVERMGDGHFHLCVKIFIDELIDGVKL